ncbi:SMAD/FHA domain-containing protein [Artemisia annua]|uniref:SMAD/FHA domain-containing protein n=1 Tax=Artemisia annua TaxID=35608 RepID=A0A2U1MF63_ARTAN|nr:SMAD/FHA domain-containing protein [Artemisia annua]
MRSSLEAKQKELVEVNKISSEQKYALEELNERHNAVVQSCTKADEIMRSEVLIVPYENKKSVPWIPLKLNLFWLESGPERCLLVVTLRSKLEDTRQKLVGSDYKVRQLESQLSQEKQVSSVSKKRVQELEHETSRLRKELESEKDIWPRL